MKWDTTMVAGGTPPTDIGEYWLDGDDSDGTPFVAISDMSRKTSVDRTSKALSSAGMRARSMPRAGAGTLLLAMYASVGEVAFLGIDATWNQALLGISPNADRVDPRFLRYVLLDMRNDLLGDVRLATQANLNAGQIGDMWFQRPPLDEQRDIADFLDRETGRIEMLIKEQQSLIDLLQERRRAHIEEVVEGAAVETRGQRLKHLVTFVHQGWSPQAEALPADGVDSWGVLKVSAVNGGVFHPEQNKALPSDEEPRPSAVVMRGELVISRANTQELLGSAAVVMGDYPRLMLSDKLYGFALDPERAWPQYVALVLGTRRWRGIIELEATGTSASMKNISQADIVNLPMDLPPLREQRRIAAHIDEQAAKIDRLTAESERFIELARERRAALITEAVTGQIDVR